MYIGLGIILLVIGAILSFAVQVNIPGVDDNLLGYILMGAGVLAILLSFAARGRRSTANSIVKRCRPSSPQRRTSAFWPKRLRT